MAQMEGMNPNIVCRSSSSNVNPEDELGVLNLNNKVGDYDFFLIWISWLVRADDMVLADNGKKVDVWSLEWADVDHVYEWYNRYATMKGFSIRRHTGFKHRQHGYWTSKAFACSREGKKKERDSLVPVKRERPDTRCGCLASITVQRQRNGKYWTSEWHPEHNHDLATPSKVHMLRSQRQMTELQRLEAIDSDRAGIRPKLALDFMAAQAGGRQHLGFTHQDLKNYLNGIRSKHMEIGVADVLLNWFGDQFQKDSEFYFRVMMDGDEHITNIFWSDHVMRNDYAIFGDFVSFDTTYRTNNEHRPLGAFVGVNHHKLSVVFGACLLYDETAQTFDWLFETFVECMYGKAPKSIFTDQDATMLVSIPRSLPETHHFLCVWHISQNALKNLGALLGNKGFKSNLMTLLFDHEVDDFEECWSKMIDEYELQQNGWLQKIYEKREQWAPKYVRNVFCAGKKTTQLSESFNAVLRRYLSVVMNMDRFLQNFQKAVDELRYNESRADFQMLNTVQVTERMEPLCHHDAEVYTPTMLRAFMEQYMKAGWLKLDCRRETTGFEEVEVHECSRYPSHNCLTARHHVIRMEKEVHQCSCKGFEFIGVLCSHIIWVLKQKGLFAIPDVYIMPRWRRDARRSAVSISRSITTVDPAIMNVVNSRKCVNKIASLCQRYGGRTKAWLKFDCYTEELEKALKSLSDDDDHSGMGSAPGPVSVGSGVGLEMGIVAKGFKMREAKHKGNKRLQSGVELRRSRGRGRGVARASSQPIARRLQLNHEFDVSNEADAKDGEDDGEDESINGRFKSLDEL